MSKHTVLVVEDNEDLRIICKAFLEHRGYAAICASDGREGIEMAKEHRPAVILTDLVMPVMDGWEVARRLGADAATRNIPVVAVSAIPVTREDQARAGFASYLRKPVHPDALVNTLRAALGEMNVA